MTGKMMTPRQREILQMLVDGDNILWDGGCVAYAGSTRTSVAMIYRLIRRMWIREDEDSDYWIITERGQEALRGENHVQSN